MNKNKMPRLQSRKNKQVRKEDTAPLNINHLYKWIAIVLLTFGLTYLSLALINGEISFRFYNNKSNEKTSKTDIDYKKILAGETFNKNHDEYYVLFYDFTSVDKDNYEAYIIDKKIPIYKVDTSDKMNSKYIVDENTNKFASNVEELKVKNPTLIKMTNKRISLYIENKDFIIKELEKIK